MSQNIVRDYFSKTASGKKWQRLGFEKRAGALIPLFSVHSANSVGIGDLGDLRLVVDWCAKSGISIVQFLPLNILGVHFCPYDALSSFALEPAYLSLGLFDSCTREPLASAIKALREKFPCARSYVDYRIKEEKLKLLKEIFLQEGLVLTEEFAAFRQKNAFWLSDFGMYIVLKEYHHGLPWYEWQERFKNRDLKSLNDFSQEHGEELLFQFWLQWQAFRQLKAVKVYAKEKGVLFKGDLPILVSRDSADVWAHPEFFKLDFAAGAPPDMYCSRGQRWGMPPYNWERIARDGYRYVREKLQFAQNFYDILRIDHVVGLFRIWSIPYQEPMENQGLKGYFYPPEEVRWGQQGTSLLSLMLESTEMLLCAEDLGVVPKVCTETLERLGIPGNDVQRWVKDWKVRHDFLEPREYRLNSIAMLSTHDTTSWAGWWENEAGTVDEGFFVRRCQERRINYNHIKDKLFDPCRSGHGRLRWRESISSEEILVEILEKRKEELMDFIDMYQNSYQEKEKLWAHLKLAAPMREKADTQSIAAALQITLGSQAVFSIESILDWLSIAQILKGVPYAYRINTPGTTNQKNWSLVIPISLEALLEHELCNRMKGMIVSSGRI